MNTLFDTFTYTYFPDPEFAEVIQQEHDLDYFEWLDEHWAYVQWY